MLKFKDLYVSLASEEPVQGPVSGIFCGWGGWQVLPVWTPPIATAQCVQNLPTSFSGPQCWTVPVLSEDDLRSLKENLKTSLQKAAARETKTIDDVAELDRIEEKLKGALEEIRARKAELSKSRARRKSK